MATKRFKYGGLHYEVKGETKMKMKLALMLFILIAMATMPYVPKTQAQVTTVTITSAYNVTTPGMTFMVNITITDVSDLFMWVANLSWDPTIIRLSTGNPDPNGYGALKTGKYNIYEGPMLKSIRPTVFLASAVDNVNGKIKYLSGGYEALGSTPSGSGVLAMINFTCVKAGTTNVEITGPNSQGQSMLVDSNGNQITHEDRDGVVTDQGPPQPPIWAQLWFQLPIITIIVMTLLTTAYIRVKRKVTSYSRESKEST